MFRCIFHFTAETSLGCKNQLIKFVSTYQEFYHDDVTQMIQTMQRKVAEFHHQYSCHPNALSINYVNWLPPYGGIILNRKAALAEKREVFEAGPIPL